jgi:hypothetical protein
MHELRALGVGVVLAEGLDLAPLYLRAVLVEQPALGLRGLAFLADQARFAALRVHAYVFGLVAVWAVGLFLDFA